MRTATGSATSAAPRGSSSSWRSGSADGFGPSPTPTSSGISPKRFWESLEGAPETKEQIVHLLFANPYRVSATFASVDDPAASADAVGRLLEGVCEEGEWYESESLEAAKDWSMWRVEAEDLPRRVQVETLLAVFDPYQPTAVFSQSAA